MKNFKIKSKLLLLYLKHFGLFYNPAVTSTLRQTTFRNSTFDEVLLPLLAILCVLRKHSNG